MMMLGGLGGLFGTGGTAAVGSTAGGVAAGGAAAGGAAAGGLSLAGVLQGIATVAGVVASIQGGDADADMHEAAAIDAETEQTIETLNGIERRSSIKAAMRDAVAAQDVAYAASGVDLSFGTAAEARSEAFREADLALTSDSTVETSRVRRLAERAASYRRNAKRARRSGRLEGLIGGARGFASILERG